MTNKFWIPALLAAATFSVGALAHEGDRDEWHEHHHHHRYWEERMQERHEYMEPRIVYPAPPAMYREPIVYAPAPTYYVAPPAYYGPPILLPHEIHRIIRESLFGR